MSDAITGFQEVTDTSSDLNAQAFLINQIIGKLATTALVKVLAVKNTGGVEAVGFVDVQPMVHQVDGAGNPTPHGRITNIPYFRLQGGTDAIILDPKVGDIGICVFCSRDISQIKRSKAPGAPASRRRYGWGDGLFIGGVLNGVPAQYVRFSTDGIEIKTANNLVIDAQNVTLDAAGTLTVKTDVIWGAVPTHASTHRHTGVQVGAGTSGPPQAGT